jgi:hypothetical protein
MSTRRVWREGADGRRYLHRVLDDEFDEKSAEFAAISIEGPRTEAQAGVAAAARARFAAYIARSACASTVSALVVC